MKVSKEKAAESRERILDTAAKLFRERGFDGIGVADLMKSAGLTHGGFYGHFASKDDLIAQVSERVTSKSSERWAKAAEESEDPLTEIASSYLSKRHRDDPGAGCLLAALGPDVARQSPKVRSGVTEGIRSAIDILSTMTAGASDAEKREAAIATYAGLIGAVVLSRSVDDPVLSEEILAAVLASITQMPPPKRDTPTDVG